MRALCVSLVLALAGTCVVGCASTPDETPDPHPLDTVLRLNHVQVKGTHNSYHIDPGQGPKDWRYTHQPLDVQLGEQGVRQFELDVHFNPDTGVFRVTHAPILDEETTCPDLDNCLGVIRAWSDAHPDHLPIWVWIEPKNTADQLAEWGGLPKLEAAIDKALPPSRRVRPDDVRGTHADLKTAVAAEGWPTLAQGRGKVVAVMLDSGSVRDAYVQADPSLTGRAMFAEGGADDPWGVIAKIDGPKGKGQQAIIDAVSAGRIIRTRADSTDEPWAGDTSRRDAAFSSGAHMVSTDFPAEVAEPKGYVVIVPGGDPARCNPVTAPAECRDDVLAGVK